jgi:hypothetical protein
VEQGFGTIVANLRTIMIRASEAPTDEAAGALTGLVKQLADTNRSLRQIAGSVAQGGDPSWRHAATGRVEITPSPSRQRSWVGSGVDLIRDNLGITLTTTLSVAGILLVVFW